MSQVKFRANLFVALLVVIPTILGCGGEWEAEIESNTSWSGSFGGRTVDGSHSDTVSVGNDDIECVVVQKDTEGGFLRVRLRRELTFMFDDETDWVQTTGSYGVVSVCSGD